MSQGRCDVPWLNLRAYDNFDLAVILSSITKQWFYYFVYGKSNFCTRPISVQWVGQARVVFTDCDSHGNANEDNLGVETIMSDVFLSIVD